MKPTQITYKQVLDSQGNLAYLEIWQGSQRISISLAGNTYGDGASNYKWETIKKTIDKLQSIAQANAVASIGQ